MRKSYTMFISLSLILIGITFAQKPVDAVLDAPANYLRGLNHSNTAIAESTIFNVMLLKRYYPKLDFTKINKKLDDLAINGPNKSIRVKAFIATNYIKNPEQYNWIEQGAFSEAATVFGFNFEEREGIVQRLRIARNFEEK